MCLDKSHRQAQSRHVVRPVGTGRAATVTGRLVASFKNVSLLKNRSSYVPTVAGAANQRVARAIPVVGADVLPFMYCQAMYPPSAAAARYNPTQSALLAGPRATTNLIGAATTAGVDTVTLAVDVTVTVRLVASRVYALLLKNRTS